MAIERSKVHLIIGLYVAFGIGMAVTLGLELDRGSNPGQALVLLSYSAWIAAHVVWLRAKGRHWFWGFLIGFMLFLLAPLVAWLVPERKDEAEPDPKPKSG